MQLTASRSFTVEPWLPANLEPLRTLSRNLWWAWNRPAAHLFEALDPEMWGETGHNPVLLLRRVSRERLEAAAADAGYLSEMANVTKHFFDAVGAPSLRNGGSTAYFSLEFALTECIPTYSGGLGVLAGDHLKSASDLGLPLCGVSLLYRDGYFQQHLTADGTQVERYVALNPYDLPMSPVLDDGGEPVCVSVPFPGRDVHVMAWHVQAGRVPLFLLDPDVALTAPEDRHIGARLYGGDLETRIQQEMILGIGGPRLLRAIGVHPAVCHMNEGHSALMALERIRELMEHHQVDFETARLAVAAGTVFTTHTPVAAGIDLFAPDLVTRYLGGFARSVGLDDGGLLALGRMDPGNGDEPFSMALLGLRLSDYRNGVSKLHGAVSRRLWSGAWPHLPSELSPITHVTNGVHVPTWTGPEMGSVFDEAMGREWREGRPGAPWERVREAPAGAVWEARQRQKARLLEAVSRRHREGSIRRGSLPSRRQLDPEALTIGFARRFAAYKRATLLFKDLDRLRAIVGHAERPVQFVFAGKAHPRDEGAKTLIREVMAFANDPTLRSRIVLLEGYDVELARLMVQGCDVWLNTPIRPLEASGTSGMKAVLNGGLTLSVADGWWAEGYDPSVGWRIGSGATDESAAVQDIRDADSLYDLLENEAVPLYFARPDDGLPAEWVAMMQRSIARLAPRFSTARMVGDYERWAYHPARGASAELRADELQGAKELRGWLNRVRDGWASLHVGDVEVEAERPLRPGSEVVARLQLWPGSLAAEDIAADLICGPVDADELLEAEHVVPATALGQAEDGALRFEATFRPSGAGHVGFRFRVTPNHRLLRDREDSGLVLWIDEGGRR